MSILAIEPRALVCTVIHTSSAVTHLAYTFYSVFRFFCFSCGPVSLFFGVSKLLRLLGGDA
jgi:hypothetical protein